MYKQIVVTTEPDYHGKKLGDSLEKINSEAGKIISCNTVNGTPMYTRDGRVYKNTISTIIVYEVDN